MADGQGWFGDSQGHAQAGSQSGGNTSDPQQHSEAGKKGAKAQPRSAKVKGGKIGGAKSHGGGRRGGNQ